MCPITTTSAFGRSSAKKSPRGEPEPFLHAVVLDVVLEDRRHLGQVEADAREVVVRERDLHREVALGRPDVDEGLVFLPGELLVRSPGWRRD